MFKKKHRDSGKNRKKIELNLPRSARNLKKDDNDENEEPKEPWGRRCCRFLYNKETKQICGRTCKSWVCIIAYAIMYLIFLSTFTMMFLYCSLLIINVASTFEMSDRTQLMAYLENGIGLTATPTSVNNQPLIWYNNKEEKYNKYIKSIEDLLGSRRKRNTNNDLLGPCGIYPYGYGSKPCVILRINKLLKWSAKPLNLTSTNDTHIPNEVRTWMKTNKPMLWLFCSGYHQYDREHIRNITYYPYPPGFDAELFPMDMKSDTPLIAVQISNFSHDISLTVQCSLWYNGGISATTFIIYVTNK